MYLKEAFRYQNYLEKLMNNAADYLEDQDNVTNVKQLHIRSKAKNGAEDEEIDATAERAITVPVNDIIGFIVYLVDEKQRLSEAINNAKAKCGFDIDAAILTNKYRQRAADVMRFLADLRSREYNRTGTDYTFNVNGDQTSYNYTIKEVTTIDYDRNKVKKLYMELSDGADAVSAKCDIAMTSTEVDFTPTFNVNGSFADAVDRYIEVK